MRKFSQWVYSWFESEFVPSYVYHNTIPKYTDSDVIEKLKSFLPIFVEEEEGKEADYYYYTLETELRDSLTPDEKEQYGVYDESDYDYIADLEEFASDIPGHRGED